VLSTVLLALLLSPAAITAAEGSNPQEERTLWETFYAPLEDAGPDQTYQSALELLTFVGEMPHSIELPLAESAGSPDLPEELPLTIEQGTDEAPAAGWVSLSTGAVVRSEELASAWVEAGEWDKALQLYSRLAKDDPEDTHLTVMLALCEYRVGNLQEARELLNRAGQRNEKYLSWVRHHDKLENLKQSLDEIGTTND
jgi:tetratricopeptide (TPR) repeat protein